jgi:hypothetical protein
VGETVPLAVYVAGYVEANGRPRYFEEQLNLLHLSGIEPEFLAIPSDDQITIPTEPSLLILHKRT